MGSAAPHTNGGAQHSTNDKRRSAAYLPTILISAGVSLAVFVLFAAVLAAAAYTNRTALLDALAPRYTAEQQRSAPASTTPRTQTAGQLFSQESRIVDIVDAASPAVVSVIATRDVPVMERYYEEYSPFGDSFSFRVPRWRQDGTREQEVGGGTGFLVSADGLVVTNRHVVSDASAEYAVFTSEGERHEVEVVARDPFIDIAVLQITDESSAESYPYLTFGNSGTLAPGQTVIAIGNALNEFRNSVSVGVVSGLSRSIVAGSGRGQVERLNEVIQTDAAINPGNSGGPLLNTDGQVIGVNVAVAQGTENIGFALPADVVSGIVASVKEYGEIVHPYLGVRYIQVNESLAERNNLSVEYGALVQRGRTREDLAVVPGSPADKAGIEENDIILSVDGQRITPEQTLGELIRRQSVGETVELTLLHDGTRETLTVTLERAPARGEGN
jgi:serine protease Do